MSQYVVTDTELEAVANAIRTKGGTNADLEWPSDFVSAIDAITGGGGDVYIQNPPISIYAAGTLNVDDGWIGEFDSSSKYFQPLNSSGSVLDVDWSKSFEICVVFKYSNTVSRSMVLFGGKNGFYYAPSIELSANGGGIWCGFTTNGSSWNSSISIGSSDGLTLQSNKTYTITATWDGTDYTVSINDGTTAITKSVTPSATHYHNSNYLMEFGGINTSGNHNAYYVKMYLPEMYISSEGTKVWQGRRIEL